MRICAAKFEQKKTRENTTAGLFIGYFAVKDGQSDSICAQRRSFISKS